MPVLEESYGFAKCRAAKPIAIDECSLIRKYRTCGRAFAEYVVLELPRCSERVFLRPRTLRHQIIVYLCPVETDLHIRRLRGDHRRHILETNSRPEGLIPPRTRGYLTCFR